MGQLDRLEMRERAASTAEIMEVFFLPLTELAPDSPIPSLMARLYGEPENISKPLLQREFGDVGARFLVALSRAIPDVDDETLRWRFHFVIGAMIHLLSFPQPAGPNGFEASPTNGLDQLIRFAIDGLENNDASPEPGVSKGRR